MRRRIIMNRTHETLAFDFDERTGHAVGTAAVIDERRMPPEFTTHGKHAVYAHRVDSWWRGRAIPSTRDGITRVLADLRLSNTVELLDRTRGLSLSDQYWVRDADEDVRWEDINFFNNSFPEQLGYALLSERSSSHRFSFDAPDASTGGDLPKRWTVGADGTRLLIKAGRTGQEPINELIASRLADRLHIPAVRYTLGEYDNRPVSICAEMLSDTEELISAWQVLGTVKRDNRLSARDQWLAAAAALGANEQETSDATDDWLLIDWLMRNIDRHYNNFALIRDVETLHARPAPLFDTGASLWAGELRISNADYKARPFFVTAKSTTARRQLHLIRHWDRYDLDALDDWPEDVARHLGEYGLMSEVRIHLIRQALQERIQQAKQARDR
ncbi:HipA domain-containing protein [Bifidobacterium sp. AGR2158]|uniref:HipA domain-containing protein n=1 Tax=Bifidobacterium sp. AGR2158 TaxID=1280675 RepID=UPI00041C5562|nr:HipA domain-containing protein [Bifidobacterium sp. AGR2158]